MHFLGLPMRRRLPTLPTCHGRFQPRQSRDWFVLCRVLSMHRKMGRGGRGQRATIEAGDLALRGLLASNKENIMRVAGFCGWTLAGGLAVFASYHLGSFSVLGGSEAARPAAVSEHFRPGMNFRPAAGLWSACTQAPIDRSTGLTIPTDCQVAAPYTTTLTAGLAKPPPQR